MSCLSEFMNVAMCHGIVSDGAITFLPEHCFDNHTPDGACSLNDTSVIFDHDNMINIWISML